MPGRTDWFWLSVRVCEMVLQVRVCLNSNSRARSISHIAAGVTAIKLLAKIQMKDTHRKKTQMWQQGTWKYGTPPPPSASVVHNVKTPNSRTTLDFLYFPVQRSYSILDLRSGSFGFELVWSSPWCRDWGCVYTATVADLLFDTSHKIDASQMMSYNKGSVAMWTKRWAIQTEELRRLLELQLEFQ